MVDKLSAFSQILDHVSHEIHDIARQVIVLRVVEDPVLHARESAINVDLWEGLHVSLLANEVPYHTVARRAT